MANNNNNFILIDWKKKIPEGPEENIKWQIANGKYEMHSPRLNDLDISVLLPHCVDTRNKILSAVSSDNALGPLYPKRV